MPILNYTTKIAAGKTVTEIQLMLAKAGADQVVVRYGKDAQPSALMFELAGNMYMLPCRVEGVLVTLQEQRVAAKLRTREQAQRVAWRILKDWVEAQVAFIQTGMADAEEVMLPYMLMGDDHTIYDQYREQRAERLLEGKSAE